MITRRVRSAWRFAIAAVAAVAIGVSLTPTAALATPARPAWGNELRILGSPNESDFRSYCSRHGGEYKGSNTAFNARCGGQPISMTDLCRTVFQDNQALERLLDRKRPTHDGAWGCFTGGEVLGPLDERELSRWCSRHGYDRAQLRGNTAGNWWCINDRDNRDNQDNWDDQDNPNDCDSRDNQDNRDARCIPLSRFDDACEENYSSARRVIARPAWEWPRGTQCWGSR